MHVIFYIAHISCIIHIFIAYNSNLLHSPTNNIYVVLICNIHFPSCFSLDKPSSGGFNCKGKTRCWIPTEGDLFKLKNVAECVYNTKQYNIQVRSFSVDAVTVLVQFQCQEFVTAKLCRLYYTRSLYYATLICHIPGERKLFARYKLLLYLQCRNKWYTSKNKKQTP
jgi:hypothetical protein